jgi:SAM-dependent methyltransferase
MMTRAEDKTMPPSFVNVYEDRARAESYAALEFPGTYYLAFRDLPEIVGAHVRGRRALDFGCGAGRSTRFLRGLGFETIGADISAAMLARARERDPAGTYRLLPDGDLGGLPSGAFDLVLSAFTFDNVPTIEAKVALLAGLRRLLAPAGRIVNLVSNPEIYLHEWASFSTRDFPANRDARSGDRVKIVMLDVADRRPVEDVLCTEADYRAAYARAGLVSVEVRRPLGRPDEGYTWVSETTIAPWVIVVLRAADPASAGGPATP